MLTETSDSKLREEERYERLIRSLSYIGISDRENQLTLDDPALDSLEWVWSTDLVKWLSSETDEVFCITGKPGSGKSTLMKYLVDHRKTRQYLCQDGREWYVVRFFFDFRAGLSTPNNIDGLLRSILLQITQQFPEETMRSVRSLMTEPLSMDSGQLLNCLRMISTILKSTLCAFIDGVDEFEGRPSDLAKKISHIRNQTGIKICIASRPGTVESSLGQSWSLAMQDFNEHSIRRCVIEKLKDHHIVPSSEAAIKIQNDIVAKAEGVILWAHLVCQELVQKMLGGEPIAELNDDIQNMSVEMGPIYDRALRQLYHQHPIEVPLTLRLIQSAVLPIDVLQLYRALDEYATQQGFELSGLKDMNEEQLVERMKIMYGDLISVVGKDTDNMIQQKTVDGDFAGHFVQEMCKRPTRTLRLCHQSFATHISQCSWLFTGFPTSKSSAGPQHLLWLELYVTIIERDFPKTNLEKYELRKTHPLLADAAYWVLPVAQVLDAMHVAYAELFHKVFDNSFLLFHFFNCDYCTFALGGSTTTKSRLMTPEEIQSPFFGLWITTVHRLTSYVEYYTKLLGPSEAQDHLDTIVEVSAANSIPYFDLTHTFRCLLRAGAKLKAQHFCWSFSTEDTGHAVYFLTALAGSQINDILTGQHHVCCRYHHYQAGNDDLWVAHWMDTNHGGRYRDPGTDLLRGRTAVAPRENISTFIPAGKSLNGLCMFGDTLLNHLLSPRNRDMFSTTNYHIKFGMLLIAGADPYMKGLDGNAFEMVAKQERALVVSIGDDSSKGCSKDRNRQQDDLASIQKIQLLLDKFVDGSLSRQDNSWI